MKPKFTLLLKKDINRWGVCCRGDTLHVIYLCHDVYDVITLMEREGTAKGVGRGNDDGPERRVVQTTRYMCLTLC